MDDDPEDDQGRDGTKWWRGTSRVLACHWRRRADWLQTDRSGEESCQPHANTHWREAKSSQVSHVQQLVDVLICTLIVNTYLTPLITNGIYAHV